MRFGIREVCNCYFKRESGIGPEQFIIDTAKMSTIEGTATTVYAQGGNGNSRLMAWEGEKTLTFILEDALISLKAFEALTGTVDTGIGNQKKYVVKTTSFAGIYSITAKTLFRDEDGIDRVATITIPKAKLQTNLNISMAPSGDPSTFTYTFDVLAKDGELFTLEIDTETEATTDNIKVSEAGLDTIVRINSSEFKVTANQIENSTKLTLAVSQTAGSDNKYTITLSADQDTITNPITEKLSSEEVLTDLVDNVLKPGDSCTIILGTTTKWFII